MRVGTINAGQISRANLASYHRNIPKFSSDITGSGKCRTGCSGERHHVHNTLHKVTNGTKPKANIGLVAAPLLQNRKLPY